MQRLVSQNDGFTTRRQKSIQEQIRDFEVESRQLQNMVYNFKNPLEHFEVETVGKSKKDSVKNIQNFIESYIYSEQSYENIDLPPGLICVPQDGAYQMAQNSDRLRLEFFSTQFQKVQLSGHGRFSLFNLRPHTFKIDIWLRNFSNALSQLRSKAIALITAIWNTIRPYGKPLMILVVQLIPLFIDYKRTGTFPCSNLVTLSTDIFNMFRCGSEIDFSLPTKNLMEFFEDVSNLKLKIQEKKWTEVLPLFLKLLRSLLKYIKFVLPFSPTYPNAAIVLQLLEFLLQDDANAPADPGATKLHIDKNQCLSENLSKTISADISKIETNEGLIQQQPVYTEGNDAANAKKMELVYFVKRSEGDHEQSCTIITFLKNSFREITGLLQQLLGPGFSIRCKGNYYSAFDSADKHVGYIFIVSGSEALGNDSEGAVENFQSNSNC